MSERQVAIEVQDLTKQYGTLRAVDQLSLTVEKGEVFGLLGPNGAGKSTSVECMEGIRQPDAGTIKILGLPIREHAAELRLRVGVQLQSTGLLPKLTVRETIELYRSFYPQPLATNDLMALVGVEGKATARVQQLSGGQKQRLTLALALVNDPELLFLDEPTTALDPQARRSIWELIADLKRQGKTVLLTTHYMEEAERLCDRVAIMDGGRIMELGTPQELINRYFNETAIEVPTGSQAAGLATSLTGVTRTVVDEDRTTLYTTNIHLTLAQLLDLVPTDSRGLHGLTIRQATLEDLFLKLTGRRIRD